MVKEKSILFFLPSSDFNETEFLVTKQIIEKAGFKTFIASDAFTACFGNNGLRVKNDMMLYNVHESNFAAFVLIGGNGIAKYWNNKLLHRIISKFNSSKRIIAAISSAPIVIAKVGLLREITAVCSLKDKDELIKEGGEYKDTPLIVRKNIITAKDPNNAHDFAETIVNILNQK